MLVERHQHSYTNFIENLIFSFKKREREKREREKEGKRERGKEGKRERGKERKRERGKERGFRTWREDLIEIRKKKKKNFKSLFLSLCLI